MKNEEMVLTFCYQCKEIMRKSGRKLKRTANDIKEPCCICKRFGWEYTIKEKKANKNVNEYNLVSTDAND